MKTKPKLQQFEGEFIVVPEYVDGGYGMDRVLRGDMTDQEWKRWTLVSSVPEVVRMIAAHRKQNGIDGLHTAIVKFLREKGLETND